MKFYLIKRLKIFVKEKYDLEKTIILLDNANVNSGYKIQNLVSYLNIVFIP